MTNTFNNLSDVLTVLRSPLPQGHQALPWRVLQQQPVGQINGLPALRGKAVATNGIIVAIWQGQGRIVFGHLDWFVVDPKEPTTEIDVARRRPMKQTSKDFSEYDDI